MKKKGIVPMPASDEQRRKIQQKLSMQRSLGGNQKQEDFFSRRQEAFTQKLVEMGMDLIEVKDFLEDKCIYEENAEHVIDYLHDPNYNNVLRARHRMTLAANQANQMPPGGYVYNPAMGG